MSLIDTLVVAVYLGGMVYLGHRGYRRVRSSSDYIVAGRRLGVAPFTACLGATVLGGASTIGSVKLGYQHGLSGAWLVGMLGIGLLALGFLLSSRISRLSVVTISEMLEERYSPAARLLSAIIMVAYLQMLAVVQIIAIGSVFSVIFGISMSAGILVGGAIVVAYTAMGGMWSVSMTDSAQFALMTVGVFILLLPAGLIAAGGWSGLHAALPAAHFSIDAIGWQRIGSLFLLYFLGVIIGQDVWQRVFTARTPQIARRGTLLVGAYCILYGVATAICGMVALALLPDLADPQLAFASLAVTVLPVGLVGLVFAGALSALMSTASGALLAVATLLANDVYRRFVAPGLGDGAFLRATRVIATTAGVLTVVIGLTIGDVVRALDISYTLLSGSLFVPVMAGIFWRRAGAVAALASMGASFVAGIAAMAVYGIDSGKPILVGILVSAVTLLAVALARRPAPAQPGGEHE